MNNRNIEFINLSFPKYYGRPNTLIDIKQFSRFYDHSEFKTQNPFLGYAVLDKGDAENKTDMITNEQLVQRINSCFQNKSDSLGVDMMFQTLDRDRDGFIGVEDILEMNKDLGTSMESQQILKGLEKITEEGTKITKEQFISIFWQ